MAIFFFFFDRRLYVLPSADSGAAVTQQEFALLWSREDFCYPFRR